MITLTVGPTFCNLAFTLNLALDFTQVLNEAQPTNLATGTNTEKGIDKNEKSGASKLFGSTRVGGGSKGSADDSGKAGLGGEGLGGDGHVAAAESGGDEKATAKSATPTAPPASEWQAVLDPNTGMTYYHNSTTGLVGIHVMHTPTTLPATLRRRSSHQFESRPLYPRYYLSRSLRSPLHLPSVTQWTDPASEPPKVSKKASPAMLLHKLLVTTNLEAYSEQFQNKGITSLDALHAMTVSSEPRQVAFSADTHARARPLNPYFAPRTYLSTILRTTNHTSYDWQTFLALGQECGMSTIEISRLFKACTDSAVQAEKDAKARAEEKQKRKAAARVRTCRLQSRIGFMASPQSLKQIKPLPGRSPVTIYSTSALHHATLAGETARGARGSTESQGRGPTEADGRAGGTTAAGGDRSGLPGDTVSLLYATTGTRRAGNGTSCARAAAALSPRQSRADI
jgi:hypothetical protein